ncbi:hypothetical protein MKY30_02305 [Oceanobacillus sp. FSL W8-0428]|uniref:Uncharacterized protein n=1 Tax=Oceanobacillus sojae TaxID=582851 RepID=A0A511ZHN3_9BACI|nr:hypothetical protein [Oceanobacillus sojae]GEN86955.1 hypothetical protein OSO01_16940 [Oceanobacillus sojae]
MAGNNIILRNESRVSFVNETTHVVYEEWEKDIVIDFIEYSTSSQNIFPILNIDQSRPNYNYDGQLFQTVNPNGTRWVATPLRISNDGHANFEVVAYDSSSGEFKLNLKTPMILPGGSRLAFKHNGTPTENHTVTYKVIYREV